MEINVWPCNIASDLYIKFQSNQNSFDILTNSKQQPKYITEKERDNSNCALGPFALQPAQPIYAQSLSSSLSAPHMSAKLPAGLPTRVVATAPLEAPGEP
jgi:hypothetical protein